MIQKQSTKPVLSNIGHAKIEKKESDLCSVFHDNTLFIQIPLQPLPSIVQNTMEIFHLILEVLVSIKPTREIPTTFIKFNGEQICNINFTNIKYKNSNFSLQKIFENMFLVLHEVQNNQSIKDLLNQQVKMDYPKKL
jgi:hypothetical protein